MIKFKFVGFIISFLTAILVVTNGNGSLIQTAFGDSDSIEDSVIVESAKKESDEASDDAEDLAEEAKGDSGDVVRDTDSEESEDDEDNGDESDDRSEDDSNDAFSDLESEIEEVGQIEDNVDKDDIDDTPGLGEGSGMQIFVSPTETRDNEDADTDDEVEPTDGNGSPEVFGTPNIQGLSQGVGRINDLIGDLPNKILQETSPINDKVDGGVVKDSRGGEDIHPGCCIIVIDLFDVDIPELPPASSPGGVSSPDGISPEGIIEGSLNILFPTGGVGAGPGPIDIGPCDGSGFEVVSGTGLCSLSDLILIDLFE